MDNLTIVFCEGDHDIAFLTRLLYVDGFLPYDKKVKDFVSPLNELYMNKLNKIEIKDSEFKFQKPNYNVPYVVLYKGETLIVMHNMGGDGNILNGKSNEIQDMYLKLLPVEDDFSIGFKYTFLYFLDADEVGVLTRLKELKILLDSSDLTQNTLVDKNNFKIGCYIFHDENHNQKKGKLEDLLLSVMKVNNEAIFENSQQYITDNIFCGENEKRQKKFKCNSEEEKHIQSIQFKEQKSIISIAGQLQFSGANNSVIIANSDYITKADILSNNACQDIIKLF